MHMMTCQILVLGQNTRGVTLGGSTSHSRLRLPACGVDWRDPGQPRRRGPASRGECGPDSRGNLHRRCGRNLPHAELPGAGAPRRRRSLQFCVVENEDAFLPTDSRGTQNGWLVCVLRWSVFSGRKSLCIAHFAFGSLFASTVGDGLR